MEEKCISDMYLAAALLSYGVEIVRIDKTDHKRQKFCFSGNIPKVVVINQDSLLSTLKDVSIDNFETLFISKKILFPPSYPESIRHIKSVIYSD